MRRIPANAGDAKLIIADVVEPSRDGNIITLPSANASKGQKVEFFSLDKGRQFLFHYYIQRARVIYLTLDEYYWGGTDGGVFLLNIPRDIFMLFMQKGEDAFYDFIKPDEIKKLERKYPDVIVKRQGSLWLFRLPGISWESLSNFNDVLNLNLFDQDAAEVEDYQIFSHTGNRLTGKYLEAVSKDYETHYLISGTLKHIDCQLLDINDGVYLVTSSNGSGGFYLR